ncbi:hypothetical protein [Pseudomonas orientalis]|uniref:hypothetical protein n=1 Tax=Pseudomonas orientalis TaxID=76758 RepID=UPI000F057C6A
MRMIQELKEFVSDIDFKTKAVLDDLNVIVNDVSGVMQQLVGFQKNYEAYNLELVSGKISSYGNIFLQSLQAFKAAVAFLTDSAVRSLAMAGAKLDMIRNEVLIAKTYYYKLALAKQLFFAIDDLVEKLDWICSSIAKNIDQILTTVKPLKNN